MPKRVQMRRDRPWRCHAPDAVIVARPSKWGNPFKVGNPGVPDRATAAQKFADWCTEIEAHELAELRGKDLACWCPLDQPCHADHLLKLANTSEN